jgi:hypothetical protein
MIGNIVAFKVYERSLQIKLGIVTGCLACVVFGYFAPYSMSRLPLILGQPSTLDLSTFSTSHIYHTTTAIRLVDIVSGCLAVAMGAIISMVPSCIARFMFGAHTDISSHVSMAFFGIIGFIIAGIISFILMVLTFW